MKITCDFGDERFRIAAARLEKDIFVRTHLHTARIVVRMATRVIVHTMYHNCMVSNMCVLSCTLVLPEPTYGFLRVRSVRLQHE